MGGINGNIDYFLEIVFNTLTQGRTLSGITGAKNLLPISKNLKLQERCGALRPI